MVFQAAELAAALPCIKSAAGVTLTVGVLRSSAIPSSNKVIHCVCNCCASSNLGVKLSPLKASEKGTSPHKLVVKLKLIAIITFAIPKCAELFNLIDSSCKS